MVILASRSQTAGNFLDDSLEGKAGFQIATQYMNLQARSWCIRSHRLWNCPKYSNGKGKSQTPTALLCIMYGCQCSAINRLWHYIYGTMYIVLIEDSSTACRYKQDFPPKQELFPWLTQYLSGSSKQDLQHLIDTIGSSDINVRYRHYDWSLNT